MKLSHEDAGLFFHLMWELQFYVNRKLNLLPGIESVDAYSVLDQKDKMPVRQAMYDRFDEWSDMFVAENPYGRPADELQIVQSWKRRVMGDFYILRFLKNYTVLLAADKSAQVYAVLGLQDSIQDILFRFRPPVLVKAMLLPFKGRIIYDGVFQTYAISFGAGIRGSLNEAYQTAKQAGKIIESLEPGAEPARKPKPQKPARDWSPVLDGVVEMTEQLKQGENVIQTRAYSIVKASARLAQAAAHDPNNLDEIAQHAKSVHRALSQLDTALHRAGWYDS